MNTEKIILNSEEKIRMRRDESSKFGTKQITITAVLLAICIVSQVFKNIHVLITGPIVNLCIVLAVLMVNLPCGIVLSIITPVTAYIIAASPVMTAVPAVIVFIMLGNIVLAVSVQVFFKKPFAKARSGEIKVSYVVRAVFCALAKSVFMGVTISMWLLPTFIPEGSPLRGKMKTFQMMFSVTQFATACIGFVYVFVVYFVLKQAFKRELALFQKSDS